MIVALFFSVILLHFCLVGKNSSALYIDFVDYEKFNNRIIIKIMIKIKSRF